MTNTARIVEESKGAPHDVKCERRADCRTGTFAAQRSMPALPQKQALPVRPPAAPDTTANYSLTHS
eukprot:395548-Pelagomonas_calceolata.AAC.8